MKVLVVDDSELIRLIINKSLAKENHLLIEAESVTEGIHKLKEEGADLVLLDIEMPEKSGFEFLTLKAQLPREFQVIPVIMMSAHRDAELLEKAKKLGAIGIIHKPIQPTTFPHMIQHILGSHLSS